MFLRPRFLSPSRGPAGLWLAGAGFVLGLAIGLSVGPVTARGPADAAMADASPTGSIASSPAIPDHGPVRLGNPVEVLRVIDGDTFEARVHLWPGLFTTTRVRLRGIDAPELKARCAEERGKAEAARDALRAILDQGEVGIAHVAFDKFGGRVLADASTGRTPDVSAAMRQSGLARPYGGGHREGWCGPGVSDQ